MKKEEERKKAENLHGFIETSPVTENMNESLLHLNGDKWGKQDAREGENLLYEKLLLFPFYNTIFLPLFFTTTLFSRGTPYIYKTKLIRFKKFHLSEFFYCLHNLYLLNDKKNKIKKSEQITKKQKNCCFWG